MKPNTKPGWGIRICSRLAVIGALSLSTALFAQTQPTPLPAAENPFAGTAAGKPVPDRDTATYIPVVYEFFSRYCHQLPSRTLNAANGRPYPVCSRCQGMYIGYFLGNFDFLIWDAFEIPGLQRWEQGLLHIGSYAALFLPLIIDGTVQYFSFDYESNNAWRMTTGLLFGYALTAIIDEIVQLILDYPGVYRHRRHSTDG